ncbi:MAG: hypothetical protein AVDCRST_MAG12-3054 [uncultured Rubrobacteraceae bacterium]|uniref:Uncharacterized protein n=1 Tax=uncultured Rubrobacteraceae bacterium TaxID=349277 RepID=A0A6J4SXC3_9ACTN|nr:MAG: hypothetical protein AVDCRST_MAG12-3054 [uncultured Rubrobacteraceae bacterium]
MEGRENAPEGGAGSRIPARGSRGRDETGNAGAAGGRPPDRRLRRAGPAGWRRRARTVFAIGVMG